MKISPSFVATLYGVDRQSSPQVTGFEVAGSQNERGYFGVCPKTYIVRKVRIQDNRVSLNDL